MSNKFTESHAGRALTSYCDHSPEKVVSLRVMLYMVMYAKDYQIELDKYFALDLHDISNKLHISIERVIDAIEDNNHIGGAIHVKNYFNKKNEVVYHREHYVCTVELKFLKNSNFM